MTTRAFPARDLLALGLPHGARGGEVVSDTIVDHKRWSVVHEVVFRLPGQPDGEAWRAEYCVAATELQDERPWEYDGEVTCTLVRRVEKVVTVWEP